MSAACKRPLDRRLHAGLAL